MSINLRSEDQATEENEYQGENSEPHLTSDQAKAKSKKPTEEDRSTSKPQGENKPVEPGSKLNQLKVL